MSYKYNDEWLAAAKQNFEQAVEEDSLATALAIIHDVRHAGFGEQANVMEEEINRIANERREEDNYVAGYSADGNRKL